MTVNPKYHEVTMTVLGKDCISLEWDMKNPDNPFDPYESVHTIKTRRYTKKIVPGAALQALIDLGYTVAQGTAMLDAIQPDTPKAESDPFA